MGLNGQQKIAVETTTGPMLVLAGAGSGKTTALTNRYKYILEQHGIGPESILAVTFTNKAAKEMKQRILANIPFMQEEEFWIATFHSICVRILRSYTDELKFIGEDVNNKFTIYDTNESKTVLKQAMIECGLDIERVNPSQFSFYLSVLKNEMIDVLSFIQKKPQNSFIDWKKAKEIINQKIPLELHQKIGEVYNLYQKKMAKLNAFDFDDIILYTIHLFLLHPYILEYYQSKFKFIMIDEYQDTNHCQYVLSKLFASTHRNIAVVGDDFQSIYAFRGSDIRNILNFDSDYPDATIIKLEENYRCGPYILEAANQIISKNTQQKEKKLFTSKTEGEKLFYYCALNEKDEARYVVNEIQRSIKEGSSFKDNAVLYRTNSQSRVFEEAFLRAGIPFQVFGGDEFFQRNEIKLLLSYLKILMDDNDMENLIHLIKFIKREEYDEFFELFLPFYTKLNLSVMDCLECFIEEVTPFQFDEEITKLIKFQKCFSLLKNSTPISELVSHAVMESGFLRILYQQPEDLRLESMENVSELINISIELQNEKPNSTLIDFLNYAAIHNEMEEIYNENAVRLMTFHSAKGLEFQQVFMVGMEEGIFPHRKSDEGFDLEEERRLCYVGVTRAKEKLHLTHSLKRKMWGKEEKNEISRFMFEFDKNLINPRFPLIV